MADDQAPAAAGRGLRRGAADVGPQPQGQWARLAELLAVSTRLGLTSFGGPIAHLGYFHTEYVRHRRWLDDRSYADLVALSQLLPGPASSQVGIAVGVTRAGLLGGLVSFIGFTLPSALTLVVFAILLEGFALTDAGWIQGLKIVAVAIVAHAVLGMGRKLAPDRQRGTIAGLTMIGFLLWQAPYSQVILIAAAGLVGLWLGRPAVPDAGDAGVTRFPVSRRLGAVCLSVFFGLLAVLPLLRTFSDRAGLAVLDSFYRAGALVFGGGHVVLPLLEREVTAPGWVKPEAFLAGYGAAQAVPGPLFTFASYLGAVMNGVPGALLTTGAIFLPAFLLIIGVLPFWDQLRRQRRIQTALWGVNAAVVGILAGALYDPIFTGSIHRPADFALAAVLFGMLTLWRQPPLTVVTAGALGGAVIALF